MQNKTDNILREAKRIVKRNKKRFNRKFRRLNKEPSPKGCQYKRNGYDARNKTMS